MSNIENLKKELVQLNGKLKEANINSSFFKSLREEELSKSLHKYFEGTLKKGDILSVSRDRAEFIRCQEDSNRMIEIITLCFKTKNFKDEIINEIETSFYSTFTNSEFELRRMITIGKVGSILLHFKSSILFDYNKIIEKFQDNIRNSNKEKFLLIREVETLEQLITETTINENNEFEFGFPLRDMYVRFNQCVNNIKGIKIISKTPSGKSATIELKTIKSEWNKETEKYDIEKEYFLTLCKVRMTNVKSFLTRNI